jgi:hypothetical protein
MDRGDYGSVPEKEMMMKRLGLALVVMAMLAFGQGQNPNFFFNPAVTTVVNVKTTSTQLFGWNLGNSTAAVCYLQMFNNVPANITLGTTAPTVVAEMPASGANVQSNPGSRVFPGQIDGLVFGSGLSVAATTTPTGSTTCATSVLLFIR